MMFTRLLVFCHQFRRRFRDRWTRRRTYHVDHTLIREINNLRSLQFWRSRHGIRLVSSWPVYRQLTEPAGLILRRHRNAVYSKIREEREELL